VPASTQTLWDSGLTEPADLLLWVSWQIRELARRDHSMARVVLDLGPSNSSSCISVYSHHVGKTQPAAAQPLNAAVVLCLVGCFSQVIFQAASSTWELDFGQTVTNIFLEASVSLG